MINGMSFPAKTGVAWRDLPEREGLRKTAHDWFWRWSRTGTLTTLVRRARVIAEAINEPAPEVAFDSCIVRCAPARPRAPAALPRPPPGRADRRRAP
nr:hypothetical protein GCM10020241_16930 [Streptoalloteichus tenebrarius]